jgi:hypothetical protein
MTLLDMIGFTAAVVAAVECVIGRVAPLDRKVHRPGILAGYAGAACICIMAASLTWQGAGSVFLELLALGIAGHLVLTWDEWRYGPPRWVRRDARHYPPGAVPSRIDGGDQTM